MTPNNYSPDADAPNADEYDDAYPYSWKNSKNNKKNMTPNTDYPNGDSHNVDNGDYGSTNSPILYSSLKRKIYPKSILKLKQN